jgi:hypothetical protein
VVPYIIHKYFCCSSFNYGMGISGKYFAKKTCRITGGCWNVSFPFLFWFSPSTQGLSLLSNNGDVGLSRARMVPIKLQNHRSLPLGCSITAQVGVMRAWNLRLTHQQTYDAGNNSQSTRFLSLVELQVAIALEKAFNKTRQDIQARLCILIVRYC